MADPEINVEIVNPPVDGAAETSGAPEIVVVETGAGSGGTDPGTILSLEMLRDQVAEGNLQLGALINEIRLLTEQHEALRGRVASLEIAEIVEPEDDGEIVVETIPPETTTEVAAETQPVARKRRFV